MKSKLSKLVILALTVLALYDFRVFAGGPPAPTHPIAPVATGTNTSGTTISPK